MYNNTVLDEQQVLQKMETASVNTATGNGTRWSSKSHNPWAYVSLETRMFPEKSFPTTGPANLYKGFIFYS